MMVRQNVKRHQQLNDSSNSTRYSRQNESRNVLEYIHGGINGAIFGAWDFVCRYASNERSAVVKRVEHISTIVLVNI